MTAKLKMELRQTYHVNWLTYAYTREAGQVGLGEYLAGLLEISGELHLLEAANDTDYSFEITEQEGKDGLEQHDQKYLDRAKKCGGIEHWALRILLVWAVNQGKLPAGNYVVSISW